MRIPTEAPEGIRIAPYGDGALVMVKQRRWWGGHRKAWLNLTKQDLVWLYQVCHKMAIRDATKMEPLDGVAEFADDLRRACASSLGRILEVHDSETLATILAQKGYVKL